MYFHIKKGPGRRTGSMLQRGGSTIQRQRENVPAPYVAQPSLDDNCEDSEAFHGWVKTWAWTSACVFVYIAARWILDACIPGDPLASAELFKQVPLIVYQMSSTAFFTALVLNLTSLLFEDNATKRQLALLSCAIKGAACHTDMLLVTGRASAVYDAFGGIVIPQRYAQWLVTTPTMVYILSKISDFTPLQTATAICLDVIMVISGLMANFAPPYINWMMFSVSMLSFIGVLYMMGLMVYSAVKAHSSHTARRSLLFIYMCTLLIWSMFPVAWALHALRSATPHGEYLNVFANFMAKVLFSSSIMYGNYMTIAQRRLLAQQAAENAHRVQIIHELKDAVMRKDQFMSLMSHELRTPLNGIIQLSDALVRGAGGEMNVKGQHFVKTIKNSSNHLLNIINDILDVAALKEGKLNIKHELCSLAKAVDHVVDIVAPLARKDVVIERFVDPHTPFIIADFSRVIQILYNLAGNALKFTHQGRVFVRVAPSADGRAVTLQVADTGIGIPTDRINGIWGAFEQVDMSVTRKYGGTGLGLSIVKQLVEAHEGKIEVQSAEGHGTTFTVTLPVLQATTRPSLEVQVTESLTKCGHTVPHEPACRRRSQRLASTSGRNPSSLEETISQLARGTRRHANDIASPKGDSSDASGNISGSGNGPEREDVLYRRRTQELERENLMGELQRRTEHKRSMEEAQLASRQLVLSGPERQAERDSRSLERLELALGRGAPSHAAAPSVAAGGRGSCSSGGFATAAHRSISGGGSLRRRSDTEDSTPLRGLAGAGGSVGSFQAWRGDAAMVSRQSQSPDMREAMATRVSGCSGYGGSVTVSAGPNSLADAYEQILIARASADSFSSNQLLVRKLSAASIGGNAKPTMGREALRISTYGRAPGGCGSSSAHAHSGPISATSSHLLLKALDSDLYRTGRESFDDASSIGVDSESDAPRSGRRYQKGSASTCRSSKLVTNAAPLNGKNAAAASVGTPPPGLTLDKLPYSNMYGIMQILSVDDEEVNQIVLEEILTSTGYHFARCMDGLEALEWLCASETMPDLILLDCMMPNMSGHEFCATLRKVVPGNVLPVIMVSAKSDEDNIVEGLRSGSNDFVRKPYQREELLARIETQLRLKSDSWWLAELVNNVDGRETESMKLLKNILPESIIARMQQGQKFVADSHAHVVILFSDIVGFTSLSSKLPTAEVFLMLSNMFTAFDKLTDRFSVYKVETIGDAYMVAAGHDEDDDKALKGTPLMRVLGFAKAMLDVVRNITAPNGERMRIRIGVHCGPAFAGVIGMKCPRYCFLGDTVNTASRMESTGFPMCIHVSENVYQHHPNPEGELLEVGEREVKGKGRMRTYLVRVGAWEVALRDLAARQQAVAVASLQQQQQQELVIAQSTGQRQRQQAPDQGAASVSSCASDSSGLPQPPVQPSPFHVLPNGNIAASGFRPAGQLTLSPSPSGCDGSSNSSNDHNNNASRFVHLLSTVTEETSLPPSPPPPASAAVGLPAPQLRLPSFSEHHGAAALAAGGGSVGGLLRFSTDSASSHGPDTSPAGQRPRLDVPRSTFGSEAYYYDESSENGAASTLNGMISASVALRSCSGSLTGLLSLPTSAVTAPSSALQLAPGGHHPGGGGGGVAAVGGGNHKDQQARDNFLVTAAKLGLGVSGAVMAGAPPSLPREGIQGALNRSGLAPAADCTAGSAEAALEGKYFGCLRQVASPGCKGPKEDGSALIDYLEQRIASLGTQLTVEASKRHQLQADLDAERRRAVAALQHVALLQHQAAAVAAATSSTATCSSHPSATEGAAPIAKPPNCNPQPQPYPLQHLHARGNPSSNSSGGDNAVPIVRRLQPPRQPRQGRNQHLFLPVHGKPQQQQEEEEHQQEEKGQDDPHSGSSESPDAEVVIVGPADDDVDSASVPGGAARAGGDTIPEPAAELPPASVLVPDPPRFPLLLPSPEAGTSSVLTREKQPRSRAGGGGGGFGASGMPGSPFILADIEWHRQLQEGGGGTAEQVARCLPRRREPRLTTGALAAKPVIVDAAAATANPRRLYGGGFPLAPGGLFGLELKAAVVAAAAAAGGASGGGDCSTVQNSWLLPRYSLDLLFEELGLLPYLETFRREAIRLDQLLGMDVGQLERLGLRPLGYCLRVREAVMDLARGLLRACEEVAQLSQPPPSPNTSAAAALVPQAAAAAPAATAGGVDATVISS
ncbi:hypothetical protein VaNZ11_015764 [Volvox africanus]|uniref:histidine kinase n=1 Tax=Volvox africanus TaxID=51714 RepID=A0ABQ5SLS6_9CHLO|nr:hypothetical protein VaNZ11_015764 [Volvox africanus]